MDVISKAPLWFVVRMLGFVALALWCWPVLIACILVLSLASYTKAQTSKKALIIRFIAEAATLAFIFFAAFSVWGLWVVVIMILLMISDIVR